jgi:predicted acylesterase/phospholipase RssA
LVTLVDDSRPPSFQDLGPFDSVLVDERWLEGGACPAWEETRSKRALAGLLAAGTRPERVLALLPSGGRAPEVAYQLGRMRAGGVLVEPFRPSDVLARLHALMGGRPVGKVALCLAGGGIEGIIFELGVLRALDAFLPARGLADLDLYCGISAGAVIGALLANGTPPDEIARGFRYGTDGLDRMRRGMLFQPSLGEIGERALAMGAAMTSPLRIRAAASLLFRAVPGSVFSGEPIRAYLERQLTRAGRTNAFRQLRRPLYVGATDQDSGEHVVFGEPGLDDVPISHAVRASTALTPFYGAERIKGRWYVDGGFTRTANISVALRHGATLVLVVDPLVPIHAPEPGYVRARGGVYAGLQGLKSLIDSRFVRSLEKFRELHPEVDVHVIRPDGDEMRALSGSPMKYFYREEIHDLAFEMTLTKIRAKQSTLGRDFARHGFAFQDPSGTRVSTDPEEALLRGRAAAAL